MSKVTNPQTEQSVSCGFYDSLNGDRKYYASDFSNIFNGVINDGVFKTIGTCFEVKSGSGNVVNVGPGKAWFNGTWTENDAVLPVDCGDSEFVAGYHRIDAVVIDVNTNDQTRDNCIKVVKGTAASKPVRPDLTNANGQYQHALCYIYRSAQSVAIQPSDITNVVGTDETPYITGILETTSRDDWFAQWRAELNEFVATEKTRATNEIDSFTNSIETDFTTWYSKMKRHMEDVVAETDTWATNQRNYVISILDEIKVKLSTDAAGNLQLQLRDIEIKHMLTHGLGDGEKTIEVNPTTGDTFISQSDNSYAVSKIISSDGLTILTELRDLDTGALIADLTKVISPDGTSISHSFVIY